MNRGSDLRPDSRQVPQRRRSAGAFEPATEQWLRLQRQQPHKPSRPSGQCYYTPTDSLNFPTNCVGSSGSVAGNGPAYVPHDAPLAAGNSSRDYGIYHAVTTAPDTSNSESDDTASKEVAHGKSNFYTPPGASPRYSAWAAQVNQTFDHVGALLFVGAALAACAVFTDGACLAAAPEALEGAATVDVTAEVAATEAESESGPWLYRGVAKEHPGYEDAQNGIARPRGGNSTPE